MKPIDAEISQRIVALVQALHALPCGTGAVCTLLKELAASRDPRAAVAALPLIWISPRLLNKVLVPRRVKTAAGELVRSGVSPVLPHELPAFDDIVRSEFWRWQRTTIARGRIGYKSPAPRDVPAGAARVQILALLASHPDGRVREAAVVQLGDCQSGAELPFALWRTVDWVAQVRERASATVRARMTPEFAPAFARSLPLVERLESMQRADQSALAADIRALLLAEPGQASLVAILSSPERHTRRAACRVLDLLQPAPVSEIVSTVASNSDPVVRMWALKWEARMRATRPEEAAVLRQRLTKDPAARIRLQTVYASVASNHGGLASYLRDALLDRAISVQSAARYYLRAAGDETDFAALYRQALSAGGTAAVPAINGLAETGDASDWALLRPFLSGTTRPARAALKAMVKLNEAASRAILLEALADKREGVCKAALLLIGHRLQDTEADILEALWPRAGTAAARKCIVAAMLKLPPWPALHALLHAVATDVDGARDTAIDGLMRWRPEHRAFYVPLPPPQNLRTLLNGQLERIGPALPSDLRHRLVAALQG